MKRWGIWRLNENEEADTFTGFSYSTQKKAMYRCECLMEKSDGAYGIVDMQPVLIIFVKPSSE